MHPAYKTMIIAWIAVAAWIAFVIYTNRRQHPKALFFLFLVELWERFSYYGMRALLILYLTAETVKGGFGFEESLGYGIYAAYGALVYLTPLAGGYLADKILGFRNSIISGALLMAAGQFTLSTSGGSSILLYVGLALLVIGNGFFKPNISSLIGRFYAQGDARRDGAFTIFYMGINIGAFLTPLTCGTVGELEGWGYGFLLAGLGMCLGLGIFLYTSAKGYLQDKADPPKGGPEKRVFVLPASVAVYLGTIVAVPVICLLIVQNDVMDYLLGTIGIGMVSYMMYLSFQYPTAERQRMWVIIILLFFTAIFWTFFEIGRQCPELIHRPKREQDHKLRFCRTHSDDQ